MKLSHLYQRNIVVMLLGAFFVCVFALAEPQVSKMLIYANEDIRFRLDPTPERAFRYGERHFDATNPNEYDIGRSNYFFQQAALKDPGLQYVNHERARVSFLRGDLRTALAQIDLQISLHGTSTPNSYYIRGLIKGFMGEYEGAARDYEIYLRMDPKNWAAITDYAWVLLKANRPRDALIALDWGLIYWPENPWLLNSKATAHFELGQLENADEASQHAQQFVMKVDEAAWLQAYPGNDPLIASQGVSAFKKAVEENMHTIQLALEKAQSDVR